MTPDIIVGARFRHTLELRVEYVEICSRMKRDRRTLYQIAYHYKNADGRTVEMDAESIAFCLDKGRWVPLYNRLIAVSQGL